MRTFLDDVIDDLLKKKYDISTLSFVLPSKRAGIHLRKVISEQVQQTIFAPEIFAIEEFVEIVSDLQYASNSELLFEFYEVYLKHTPELNIEPFDKFSKWAQILIQDFNEIDRYLIPPHKVFDYLSAIKEIEHQHWSLDEDPTEYIQNYLEFWKRLKTYYDELKIKLKENNKGYQGMVYREAVNNLEQYTATHHQKTFVFVGFNALNTAEEFLIQELLQQDLARIYWDIDETFINNPIHDAGLFTRKHKAQWAYFNKHPFEWIGKHYKAPKDIQVIGVPKHISQIKYVGEVLEQILKTDGNLAKTAVVLGDETLLLPLLNSIPSDTNAVNITMGLPLKVIPLATLFELLFELHKRGTRTIYYKDVIKVLSHQFISVLFKNAGQDGAQRIIAHIQTNNNIYISLEQLEMISADHIAILRLLFGSWGNSAKSAISNCLSLISHIKSVFDKNKERHKLSLEYLYRFHQIFNTLEHLNLSFSHINSIQILHGIYKELLKSETLDFQGEPLQGLQIMGMLESRVLDFERVIITSMNEGVLPAGKSNNSFIPFDVKVENELPTYKEKDAVYTYHFYRLIQRTKEAYILYNTEPDVLQGSEKSRFITQLEIEGIHDIKHHIVTPSVPKIEPQEVSVQKTSAVIDALDKVAQKGFSPSSLTNYIRNPIDFYYEKVLGIRQYDDVEERVAYNTLGTVIHNTLEDFYKPLEGKLLEVDAIKAMHPLIHTTIEKHFQIELKSGNISKGKNLIIFEIAKRYVSNFLDLEIADLKKGNEIEIVAIEQNANAHLELETLNKTINLNGKVDRVDRYNGTLRIIDYKTGRVDQGKVEIINWEDITTDYDKYSKSFQVLMYCYMMHKSGAITLPVEGGIFSFRNLSSGLLKFAKKPAARSKTKDMTITEDTLMSFEQELKRLITELFDPTVDFIAKDVE